MYSDIPSILAKLGTFRRQVLDVMMCTHTMFGSVARCGSHWAQHDTV
jgi:hypothetical protein